MWARAFIVASAGRHEQGRVSRLASSKNFSRLWGIGTVFSRTDPGVTRQWDSRLVCERV